MGCHFLHQGIFPTQGSNPHFLCLLHYRQILYLLSHQRSPLYLQIACRAWCLPAQEHQLSQKWLWRHLTRTPAGPSGWFRASSPCGCVGGWPLQVSLGRPAQKLARICLRGGEKASCGQVSSPNLATTEVFITKFISVILALNSAFSHYYY